MSMPDDDARAILREHGHEPPSRGKLAPRWRDLAQQIRDGAEPGSPPPDPDGEPDYDGGVTAADFPPDPEMDGHAPAEEPGPALPPERKPRPVRAARPSLRDRLAGKPAKGKPKGRARPRVPVDRFIGRVWEGLARLAVPVSGPVSRTLAMQAPVAGLILEDSVRGTVVDKALQPVVRVEARAEKVIALAGPPLLVGAIEQAQGLPDPQRQMRLAILLPMLEESLTLWVKIAGDKIEAAAERAQETEEIRSQVQAMMGQIFAAAEVAGPQMAGAA